MCLIAWRPASPDRGGSNIPNMVIDQNMTKNPDGFGIAWRDGDRFEYEKFAPGKGDSFRSLLKKIDKRTKTEYVAHWRLATHGPKCEEMSHPFPYNDPENGEVLVFHNGVISIKAGNDESDTSAYVNRVLANLPSGWWKNKAIKYLVEETIGWSRLLIMTKDEIAQLGSGWLTQNGIHYSTTPTSAYGASRGVQVSSNTGWTARTSGVVLPAQFDDDDDDDEDGILIAQGQWYHIGHPVSPITGGPGVDENYGIVICDVCQTKGDYYVIEGKRFVDLRHQSSLL